MAETVDRIGIDITANVPQLKSQMAEAERSVDKSSRSMASSIRGLSREVKLISKTFLIGGLLTTGLTLVNGLIDQAAGKSGAMADAFERLPFGLGRAFGEVRRLANAFTDADERAQRLAATSQAIGLALTSGRAISALGSAGAAGLDIIGRGITEDMSGMGLEGSSKAIFTASQKLRDTLEAIKAAATAQKAKVSDEQRKAIIGEMGLRDDAGNLIVDDKGLVARKEALIAEREAARKRLNDAELAFNIGAMGPEALVNRRREVREIQDKLAIVDGLQSSIADKTLKATDAIDSAASKAEFAAQERFKAEVRAAKDPEAVKAFIDSFSTPLGQFRVGQSSVKPATEKTQADAVKLLEQILEAIKDGSGLIVPPN